MFYQGTLQEGISTAVGQQKLVLCFVTNETEESERWENEFLQDSSLLELIQTQAVALRLIAESEETGYLSQIFPLPKTPTVVIMKHGELREYIAAGTSKEDFLRRVRSAFNAPPDAAPSPWQSPSPSRQPASAPAAAASSTQPASMQAQGSGGMVAGQSDSVSQILAERAAKLKAQKEEAERKAKAERAEAQQKAKAEAEAGPNTAAAMLRKQAEDVKKKRQQKSEERDRILERIDDDKRERRMRASTREQARIGRQKVGGVAASLVNAPETKLLSTSRVSDMVSLQVRLFDGSTIRSRFKATSVLQQHVRNWVDSNRSGNSTPYSLKQVLTPRPNKDIDETEESKTLGELGLAPSATLVLVPKQQKYSSAYDGGSRAPIWRLLGMLLGFYAWLLGLVGLADGSADARGPASGNANNDNTSAASLSLQDKDCRVRGLQDAANRPRDHQLYNGNSLNFEPRPDDDDDDDDEK